MAASAEDPAPAPPGGFLERYWRRGRAEPVKPVESRLRAVDLDRALKELGRDGPVARRLDAAVEETMSSVSSLSSLTSQMALDYVQRVSGPAPALTPPIGVQIVARAYLAHLVVEADPAAFGAEDVPVLGTLPPLKKGRPPQDIVSIAVKASRRNFDMIRAVSTPVWHGFVKCLVKRSHDMAGEEGYISEAVVDGVARYGWVLRQVDIHYGLEPQRPNS